MFIAEDAVAVGVVGQGQVVGDDVVELHLTVDGVLKELWHAPVPRIWMARVYDGRRYLPRLMHCSGTYRIWLPAAAKKQVATFAFRSLGKTIS
ncbi:hypothetical protein [Hymenobacter sp. PAMC 26628]|uniref:hypothetical protein n=1 Tax=Hymenobacter sp. PAMC 26628 TaxID=1484118 RepID=UPI00076FE0F2|nr:hypothetical protein [Hymenobacter sp. PAMC 26628]AMJ66929.1 hypothetical protein AXW84_16960 [Hymenobacter sp. PAMC 26628]